MTGSRAFAGLSCFHRNFRTARESLRAPFCAVMPTPSIAWRRPLAVFRFGVAVGTTSLIRAITVASKYSAAGVVFCALLTTSLQLARLRLSSFRAASGPVDPAK